MQRKETGSSNTHHEICFRGLSFLNLLSPVPSVFGSVFIAVCLSPISFCVAAGEENTVHFKMFLLLILIS